MVRYLNNRGSKSRANRQADQAAGQEANAQNPQNAGEQQGNPSDVSSGSQNVSPETYPFKTMLANIWHMGRRMLEYEPREVDDNFSLGGRRTGANSEKAVPGQQEKWLNDQAQGAPQQGAPQQGAPQQGAPQQGAPQQGAPQQGAPQQGAPQQGTPQSPPPPPQTAPFYAQNPGAVEQQPPVVHTQQGGTPVGQESVPIPEQVHYDLDKNLMHVKRMVHYPDNKGFTIREFTIGLETPWPAFIVFTEGLADKNVIDNFLLEPLMLLSGVDKLSPQKDLVALVKYRLVTTNQVEEERSFRKIIDSVLMGSTAIFVEGANSALLVETKGWEHRPVGRPLVENVVRGPQEGFNEVLISNIALIRSRLRTENLVSEMYKVGTLSKADVSVMYLRDMANPALVGEVRKRIQSLKVDYIPDTGMLEQFIEDNSVALMPQTLATERPDRVAAFLAEGHVAILMSSSPFALIVPITFWAQLHSAEDAYVRWPYGSLLRIVRVAAVLIGMFLDGFYIAIVNYHQAMIPHDLLFAIAASHEMVPFPTVVEVILLELAFELIREAGIRIPTIIGPTIGIVGALILGQAAVMANLITPLVIIIVALTGLSSFAIPNYNLSFQVRIVRFIYIFLAAIGGFVAMSGFMVVQMALLCNTKSFGVPLLSPASPHRRSKDTVLRGTLWSQESRPEMLRPLASRREPPVSRPWNPSARPKRGE
ncbi:MAG: spore germination protein [Peptococcaceae bacterium]|nr:spore germination protein [Peptococcaceae bacterium]